MNQSMSSALGLEKEELRAGSLVRGRWRVRLKSVVFPKRGGVEMREKEKGKEKGRPRGFQKGRFEIRE